MIKSLPAFCNKSVSVIVITLCLASPVWAADKLSPRAEVNVRAGTERSILMTEFWAPLVQQSDRVLYGDLRLMGDDGDNREGNLGFGYRQIFPKTNSVLGANAWIDRRRTENGNNFHQITLGVESLGETVDIRANGYIQLNGSKTKVTPNIGSVTPYLAGSGIFFDTNGFIVEEPQHGFDAEIGYRLPILQKYVDATRVYAGGYHFFGDNTENTTGFRIRTEAQINSMFSVGARFQHDEPRGSQGFLEATLRFPFKSKKLYQEHGLRSRLDESPERDIDIVTGAKVDTGLGKQALNASGTEQRILYVDNTNLNSGDGTKENPFNTLTSAQAAMQTNDILYINRGDGTTTGMDQGIVIDKTNVQLIGSGSALTYEGYTLLDAGMAPVITNNITPPSDNAIETVGNGIFVTKDNASISGVTINNAQKHGIYAGTMNGERFENLSISNVTVNVAGIANNNYSIYIQPRDNGHIENASLSGITVSGGTGIAFSTLNGGTLTNAFADTVYTNNAGVGRGIIVITNTNGGNINSVNFSNITTVNTTDGIRIDSRAGKIESTNISNALAINSSGIGLIINTQSSGQIGTVSFTNSAVRNGTSTGLVIQSLNNGIIENVILSNNVFDNNVLDGVQLYTTNNGKILDSVISDNLIVNNDRNGIHIWARDPATSIVSSMSGNTITNNSNIGSSHGIRIDNDTTEAFNVDLGGGTLGSAGGNRIFDNTFRDVYIDSQSGTSSTGGITISAQNNWWGVNTGLATGRRTLDGTSQIDSSNHLTTDPSP